MTVASEGCCPFFVPVVMTRPHRVKGGAPQLGAEEPVLPGPFGTWTGQDDQEAEESEGDARLWC
ncbi:hypothetical protein [Streptomyces sp. NPDC054783]